ncbi:MAG: outer membrane protein assembly factor BamD [Verrucomicrobia bacterium]|nr:outer membrane protein assembly factor BamD [Verrucomicrobiota bacterium]
MRFPLRYVLPLTIALVGVPVRSPAPIIYREGEGFSTGELADIEIKKNAQEQYDLGERYEREGDYKRAGASYRLVVRRFPRSDVAAHAQYKSGQMYEKTGELSRAFNEYQGLVEKYPRSPDFEAALQAQYAIAKAYVDGKRLRIYGVPTIASMSKAQSMFEKIVRTAPYSRVAPLAQYGVGQALEKMGAITPAINAYQQVVDRYPSSEVADSAMYQIAYVYFRASREVGYDETSAVRAQEGFEDFLLKYPNSEKAPQARDNLKTLQGRKTQDAYSIARFYDKQKKYRAAYTYYNEVIQQQPDSQEAERAKERMDQLRAKVGEDALTIGTEKPQVGQPASAATTNRGRNKPVPQYEAASRPDFVGPPAPTPTPTPAPTPAQSTADQKPMVTPPGDVAPQEPPLPAR